MSRQKRQQSASKSEHCSCYVNTCMLYSNIKHNLWYANDTMITFPKINNCEILHDVRQMHLS